VTSYSLERHRVETNSAKIQNHNTVQRYNSEENPFKINLFLCFRRILVRSAAFDSHPAARGRSWITLNNWRNIVSDEQFLTSPFLPARFHLFSHQLKIFRGGPKGPLRGGEGRAPSLPRHLPRLPRPLGEPAAIPQQLYKPASRGLSAIAELLVCDVIPHRVE